METTVLVKFLKHLISCTEDVLAKEEIEMDDVSRLRRELSELKRHIDGMEKTNPVLLGQILDLELHVDEKLFDDTMTGRLRWAFQTMFGRSPLVRYARLRRFEKAKQQLADFRDKIDHIRFAIEF